MGEAATTSWRLWLAAGAANGLIAVAMGAFAAHGLKDRLPPEALGWIKTAADYQMWHGLALLGIAALTQSGRVQGLRPAGWALLLGMLLFSGSLYLLALTGWRSFAFVTPIGGAALLLGWALILWRAVAGARDR